MVMPAYLAVGFLGGRHVLPDHPWADERGFDTAALPDVVDGRVVGRETMSPCLEREGGGLRHQRAQEAQT